ncbi:L,D-transpeptidase [Leptolyngbya ohadii]|uniref:L,D-transpeptidase n=1 Tax=Leptolyngbya ohadii TaxID=1962290 RepID=UPI001CECDB15|nr:L,D-transpeptidase [Leptolyngbya ohadii]
MQRIVRSQISVQQKTLLRWQGLLLSIAVPLVTIPAAVASQASEQAVASSVSGMAQARPLQAPAANPLIPQLPQSPARNLLIERLAILTTPELPALGSFDRFLPQPQPITRLVIRLGARRVYVYENDRVKTSFPVAVGRRGWETPTGSYRVLQMIQDPAWQNPFTGEVIPPGQDNPLGTRWIGFWTDGSNFIGFHGTPNEETVGTPASHGCIRMFDRDVQKLFEMVAIGTPVSVVP